MTFLSHRVIEKRLSEFLPHHGDIEYKEKDGTPKYLQGSSFELRLGDEVFLSSEKKLVRLGGDRFDVTIQPGDFAILLTCETVAIPRDLMALISIKTSFKNMGLVNISGFHVDPGWKGKLTFSVYNAGPGEIMLRHGEPLFIIFFAALDQPVDEEHIYKGEHKDQDRISSRDMNKLTGKPVSPFELEERLHKLEYRCTIQWGLLIALTIGLLLAFIRTLFFKV